MYKRQLQVREAEIFQQAELSYPSIVKRGGGLRDLQYRAFDESFVSVDFLVDVKDAMGANIVNAMLEGVAELFREWFAEQKILFSILSNYATESVVTMKTAIPVSRLSKEMCIRDRVTTVEDNVIIGAQIAGVGASDMISELALAIESGMNAEDIALTIHPHPSLGEITMDTAELALGLPIHI